MVVVLYTGTGPGKTSAALGIALRALGHGKRIVVVQFMKWWKETGEYRAAKKLGRQFQIRQFGRKGWIGLKNLGPEDRKLALEGLGFAEKALRQGADVLVLDEINLALHCGLLKVDEVLSLLRKAPKKTVVILTGRHAPRQLLEMADVAVELKERKLPKKMRAIEGLNF